MSPSHQNSFWVILFGLFIEFIIAVFANLISSVAEQYFGLNDISAILFVIISLAIFITLRAFLLVSFDIDTSFLEPHPILDFRSLLISLKRSLMLAWGHFVVIIGLAITVGYAYFLYSYGIYPVDLDYRLFKCWLLLIPWLFIPLLLSRASQYREEMERKAHRLQFERAAVPQPKTEERPSTDRQSSVPVAEAKKQPSTNKPTPPLPLIAGIQEGFVTFTITVRSRHFGLSQDDRVQIAAAPSASIADAFADLNLTLLEPLDRISLIGVHNTTMFPTTLEPARSAWTISTGIRSGLIYTGTKGGIIDMGNINLEEIIVPAQGYNNSAVAIANHVYAVRSPSNIYGIFKIIRFDAVNLEFPGEYKMIIQLRYRADGGRNLGETKLSITEELIKRYEAGERSFKKEDLSETDLREVNLSRTDLEGANLSKANLSRAILVNAYLFNANLKDACLEDCKLSKAILSQADLTGATLLRADLSEAILVEANLNGASLEEADLTGANLTRADLRGKVKLEKADLEEAVLIEVKSKGADLRGANLIRANLKGARLIEANLVRAKLMGAILEGANLARAYLIWTNLEGADFTCANLEDAKVTDEQLNTTKSLKGATMPDGTTHD